MGGKKFDEITGEGVPQQTAVNVLGHVLLVDQSSINDDFNNQQYQDNALKALHSFLP